MNTVEPIPDGSVHPTEKRMRPELAAMGLVTPDRPLQLGESRHHVHGGRRSQIGIDRNAGWDSVCERPREHAFRQEPSLEAVPAQINSVDRTIDAVGEMLADLGECPVAQHVVRARLHPTDIVEHFGQTVEVKPSPA